MPPHVSHALKGASAQRKIGEGCCLCSKLLLLQSQHYGSNIFTIIAAKLMNSPKTFEQLHWASKPRKERLSPEMISVEVSNPAVISVRPRPHS
jgi:hypothetical protein